MRFKRENKGFSLVELVVVIAIFSVVGVVVGGFLFTASRSYSISANELELQEEAQLVANQVQEMILDASLGISYEYVVTDDTGAQLINYMDNDASVVLPSGDLSQKNVYIYGKSNFYHISWDTESKELYLMEYDRADDGSYAATADMAGLGPKGVVFGEFISDFQVDLSKVASDRLVSFTVTFQKNGTNKKYPVTRTVSLRNNVMTNEPADEVYDAVNLEFEPKPDGIDVIPKNEIFLWPGDIQQYMATLTCTKGGVPSQDVAWVLTSEDGVALSEETKMSAGNILKIASDEKCSRMHLVAKAQGYDYDTSTPIPLEESHMYVNVRQISALTIVRNDFEDLPVSRGGTYYIVVELSGDNLDGIDIASAGGIDAQVSLGNEYAAIEQMTINGKQATFKIKLSDTAPQGGDVALTFRAARPEFANVRVSTGAYEIGGSDNAIFDIYSDSGVEWFRLGSATTKLEFAQEILKDTYCDANGNLLDGYFIRYTYQIYDCDYNLKNTAYTMVGASNAASKQDYISYFSHSDVFTSKAGLNDKVFLQSGTVVVKADLMHNTAGSAVVVGSSDNLSYFIPEASISYKRAAVDEGVSNMKVYITSKVNTAPIYISFPTGFAASSYKIDVANALCTPTELGSVSGTLSDTSKNKIVVEGSQDAEYKASENNVIEFTYGGLSNSVSIVLTSPNVIGTDYYVPLNQSEWRHTSIQMQGSDKIDNYLYYIDDAHRMIIHYKNGVFYDATFYSLKNNQWVESGNYTMNKINKTWDLATP